MPTEPLLFTLEAIGNDKILVKWSTSQPASGKPVNHYNIYWKTLKGQENVKSVKGSADSYRERIDGLRPATQYEFRIVAVESDGAVGRRSVTKVQSTDRKRLTPLHFSQRCWNGHVLIEHLFTVL